MLFNSYSFIIFFVIVLIVYFIIPNRLRVYWLLLVSYYFYLHWNPKFFYLIFGVTVISYLAGIIIENLRWKKFWLVVAITSIIGTLFYFKYLNFFLESLNNAIPGREAFTTLDIILPVGISFYSFQAIGYMIDVYRQDIKAEKNLIVYALFVAFFPQLVAGPIERSRNLLSQVRNISKISIWNIKNIYAGLSITLWGFFMKIIIANRVAQIADYAYMNLKNLSAIPLIIGTFAFSIQIYCDFAGYTYIAIGTAKMMGIVLNDNFLTPYFSTSIKDFWRRWHISLSSWFRDYLYIPLGGGKGTQIQRIRNKLIVFSVSGLWHGANWTYILWGTLHGLYLVIEDVLKRRKKLGIISIIFTFLLVNFAWIFFRADTVGQAFMYIANIVRLNNWRVDTLFQECLLGQKIIQVVILLFALIIMIVVDLIQYRNNQKLDTWLLSKKWIIQDVYMIVMVLLLIIFGEYGINYTAQEFIYFQF